MKINQDLIITGMYLDNFEINVPEGLSELLNRSGAWEIKKKERSILKQYNRQVKKIDGNFVTILTLKEGKKSFKK